MTPDRKPDQRNRAAGDAKLLGLLGELDSPLDPHIVDNGYLRLCTFLSRHSGKPLR